MSCMVMTKRHIDHVIDAIKFDSRNFQSNEPLYQQHVLALGAEFKTPMAEPLQYGEWESLLGGLIWKLNHDAYDDRYSHANRCEIRPSSRTAGTRGGIPARQVDRCPDLQLHGRQLFRSRIVNRAFRDP